MFREYPPKSTVDTRWAKLTIWPTSVWHFFLLAKFRDCAGVVHYIVRAMVSQITSLTIVYSTVYSGSDQRKRQSSASLAFVRGIHRWPMTMNGDRWIPRIPVTRKIFPFNDVIMLCSIRRHAGANDDAKTRANRSNYLFWGSNYAFVILQTVFPNSVFFYESYCILIEITLKFTTKGPIDNDSYHWLR